MASRSGLDSSMSCFSFATFPTSLYVKTSPSLSPSTATPAESYPRYSRRDRPIKIEWSVHANRDMPHGEIGVGQRTLHKCLQDIPPIPLHKIVDVPKNATNRTVSSQLLKTGIDKARLQVFWVLVSVHNSGVTRTTSSKGIVVLVFVNERTKNSSEGWLPSRGVLGW